jgi:hypothetical protein
VHWPALVSWQSATTRSSLAKQLGHCFLVRNRTRPASGYPLTVSGQRCFDLHFLQQFCGGKALHRLEPPQIGEWDNRRRFAP